VSTASLHSFIDMPNYVLKDSVQYSTVHIPNVVGWNCLKYCIFACFLYCNRQAHRDFLITLYYIEHQYGNEAKHNILLALYALYFWISCRRELD
jgi:hypothetical protein